MLIGMSISHNLFFQQMRHLMLYKSSITILKFSYFKHFFFSFYVNLSWNGHINFLIWKFLWSKKNSFYNNIRQSWSYEMNGWSDRMLIKMTYIYSKYCVGWFLSGKELFEQPNIKKVWVIKVRSIPKKWSGTQKFAY